MGPQILVDARDTTVRGGVGMDLDSKLTPGQQP